MGRGAGMRMPQSRGKCAILFKFRFESRRRRRAMWPAAPDILQSYRLFDAIYPLRIAASIATSTGM